MKPQNNEDLLRAFPSSVRDDVGAAVSALPENPHGTGSFRVHVEGETLDIPNRVYHNPALIGARKLNVPQRHLLSCILTRHHDGHVRQDHLAQIIGGGAPWVPAYVIPLLGEYIIEIHQLIESQLQELDKTVYRNFLVANQEFLGITEQRVISYWDCFYRTREKGDYVGFRVLQFFKDLVAAQGGHSR